MGGSPKEQEFPVGSEMVDSVTLEEDVPSGFDQDNMIDRKFLMSMASRETDSPNGLPTFSDAPPITSRKFFPPPVDTEDAMTGYIRAGSKNNFAEDTIPNTEGRSKRTHVHQVPLHETEIGTGHFTPRGIEDHLVPRQATDPQKEGTNFSYRGMNAAMSDSFGIIPGEDAK
ncbi:hypothetical protein HDU93_002819, partial [Gonapodya sp. JEL0774]